MVFKCKLLSKIKIKEYKDAIYYTNGMYFVFKLRLARSQVDLNLG